MKSKIFNIVIFTIAIIGCIFSLWFAAIFNDTSDVKEIYYAVNTIKDENPQMITDIKALTMEQLPAFLAKYSEEDHAFNTNLKDEKLQKDILFTFIDQLKTIDTEEDLANYKANFSAVSQSLLIRAKNADKWIKGFQNINSIDILHNYITSLDEEYVVMKQDYLLRKDYSTAVGKKKKKAAEVNNIVSQSKKTVDFNTLMSNVKQSLQEASRLNVSVILVYVVFFIALIITLFFAIIQMISSIKTSYKALLAVLGLVLIYVVSYLLSSGEMIPSAVALGHTVSEMKAINAGIILCYILLFATILSMIGTAIYNKFKKV